MENVIEHDGAQWAGSASGYVCLHCKAVVSDAQWGEWLASKRAPAEPEPEPVAEDAAPVDEPDAEPEPMQEPAPEEAATDAEPDAETASA